MIGDLLSNTAQAQKLDIAQLQRAIQDGTLPAYVGLPLLQEKLKQRNEAAALLGGQKKPPTVKDQLMSSADQVTQAPEESEIPIPQGAADVQEGQDITALRSNLPGQYAGGGIIAFADRGEVELPEGGDYPEEEEEEEEGGGLSLDDLGSSQFGRDIGLHPQSENIEAEQAAIARSKAKGEFSGLMSRIGNYLTPQSEEAYKSKAGPAEDKYSADIGKDWKPELGSTPSATSSMAKFLKQDTLTPRPRTPDQMAKAATISDRTPAGSSNTVPATRVAQPTPQAAPETTRTEVPAPTPQASGIDDMLQSMQDDGKASREDLKNLILGSDDSENELKQRALLAMMEGGFKTAAGKSPYASVNIGEGGAEGVRNLSEGIAQIDADKRNRISQLVNLGLKGQELDQAAARLGLTKADIEAHAPYLAAQANLANTAARQNEVETGLLPQKFALEQSNAALRAAGATGGRPQMVSMSGSDLKPIQEKWGAMYNNPAAYAAQLGLSPTDLQYLKDDPKSPTSQRIIQDKVRPRVQAGFAQDYRNAEASKTKHAQGSYTPVFNP